MRPPISVLWYLSEIMHVKCQKNHCFEWMSWWLKGFDFCTKDLHSEKTSSFSLVLLTMSPYSVQHELDVHFLFGGGGGRGIPSCAQGLLMDLWEQYKMPGIKPRLAKCRENALPTVLSLEPLGVHTNQWQLYNQQESCVMTSDGNKEVMCTWHSRTKVVLNYRELVI